MRTYIAFYKGQQRTVEAESSFQAQEIAKKLFKAKNGWEVTVMLADITHSTQHI